MNTPVPTWRELGQRIALLIIVEARAIRRSYRHWRVRRRYRKVKEAVLRVPFEQDMKADYVAQQMVHAQPGQVIYLRNGERPDQFIFRQPNAGSMIPGPRRSASDYKAALDRLEAMQRQSNAETDAERNWLAVRPGRKR